MKRWIIFTAVVLASQLSLGQHLFEPSPPPGQKLPDRSNMAEWWRTNLIVPAFVESVRFSGSGNWYTFPIPEANLTAASPGRYSVYLNFRPAFVSEICFRCESPFGGLETLHRCISNSFDEGRVMSPCPPDNGNFSHHLAALSARAIFQGSRIDFYANEFATTLSSATGGANFRIRGQPWSSTWNNNGWSGNWASGWVDLATRTNNNTVSHTAQWTGNNRNRRAFRIYQNFTSDNAVNTSFRNNSIIVFLHSLPLLSTTIEVSARPDGRFDYFIIPFTAPLGYRDRIYSISAINAEACIVPKPIDTITDLGASHSIRVEIKYDFRGNPAPVEYHPMSLRWRSGNIDSDETVNVTLRITRAPELTVTPDVTSAGCPGETGNIRIYINGGRPISGNQYSVTISGPNGFSREYPQRTSPVILSGLSPGDYTIIVRDRDGTEARTYATLDSVPTAPVYTISVETLPLWHYPGGGTAGQFQQGRLRVNSTNNNHSFSWSGAGTSDSGSTFSPPRDGTFTLTVGFPGNNNRTCTRPQTITIGADTLHRPQAQILKQPYCVGSYTGTLLLSHSKQDLPGHSLSWYKNGVRIGGETNALLDYRDAGNYWACINYRGVSSCTTVDLRARPMLITVIDSLNLRCHEDSSGMVVLRVRYGGENFMWNDSVFSDTIRIERLPAQPQITIRDMGDIERCETKITVNLTQPDRITITPIISNVKCYEGNTGSIALSISGGTLPFAVAWKPEDEVDFLSSGNNTMFPNLFAGRYEFKVTDGHHCIMETGPVGVTQPKLLQIDTIIADSVTGWGSRTGKIRATVSGGTTPYAFTWTHRETNASFATASINVLTNIPTGLYDLMVTDSNSCITFAYVYVPTPDSLTHIYTIVHCTYFGSENGVITPTKTDGKITVTVRGGVKPYRFVWSKNGTVIQETISPDSIDILRDREGGIYTLLVIDRNGYYFRDTFEIFQWTPLVSQVEQTHIVSCNGEEDATLVVAFKGGTPGYYRVIWQRLENWQWHTIRDTTFHEANTNVLNNIGAGQYRAVVSDSFVYRSSYYYFEVWQPDPLHIASEVQILTRIDVYDAWIEVAVTGGRRPYVYSWTKEGVAFSTDLRIENLLPGMYTFHVSDSMVCFATKTLLINEINDIEITAEITHRSYRVASQGILTTQDTTPDGRIELRIRGGVYPYTVEWFLEGAPINITGQIATGLVQGNYQVRITDAVGNVAMEGFYVHQRQPLIARIDSVVHVSCFGNADGFLRATVTGGAPPHTFTWNTPNLDTTRIITGLIPRIYTIIVTDSMGRQSNYSVEIREPNVLTVAVSQTNINCWGDPSGAFTLTPSGGNPPFWFSNDEHQILRNTFTVSNLYAGYYYANIIDQRGCTQSVSIELTQPERLSVIAEIQHPICYGYADGSIALKFVGGVEPHDFIWLNHPQQNLTITDLRSGVFNLRLYDGNNCRKDTSLVLIDPPKLVVQNLVQSIVLCAGQHHQPVPQPDTLNFQWWSPELRFTSNEQSPKLHSGIYFVRALNQHRCYAKDSILIIQAPDTVVAQFWLNSDVFINEITTIVHVSYPVPDSALWVVPDNVEIISYSFEYIELIFHEQGEHTVGLIAYKGACVDYAETLIFANGERKEEFLQNSPTLFDYAFVSPNPSRDYFELRFRTRRDADLLIQLFRANTAQQPVRTFRRNARAYQTETEVVSVQNLPPGTYVLTIQHNTDRQVLKLIIL